MSKLGIHRQDYGQVTLITLTGTLDSETSDDFDEEMIDWIEEEERTSFVVDLAGLSYISSAGIGVLVGCLNQLQDCDGDLRLSRVPDHVRHVLDMLALMELFTEFTDQASAVRSYS